MRGARAYSSFCSQVVLVCVIHFVAIHASAGENRKKCYKNLIVAVQGHLKSSMLIRLTNHFTSACYDEQHVCTYLQAFSR